MSMSERDWASLCLELLERGIIDHEDEFSRQKEYMLANYPLFRFALSQIEDELNKEDIARTTKHYRGLSDSEEEDYYKNWDKGMTGAFAFNNDIK